MADLHLGFRLDPKTGKPGSERLVVESGDLTTHGVILGMTGSGKTGLAVDLIEEILLAGIPCLVLDPKGDMGNLLLTFPELDAASFRPWVNEDDARSEGLSLDEFAAKTATTWREGLEAQGIGADWIRALRESAEFTVYTPGSESGAPLNVVGSLDAPTLSWESEAETLRDEIEGTVTSLLGLVGIETDPLSSREHVLLSNLIEHAWRARQSLDLGALLGQIQSPPIRKLGVFEVDTFFPPKERTELALKLNGLVASPAFAAWGAGQPLDPATLLRTPEGKPRCAIVYLAHLSDQERQFVVTLVLSKRHVDARSAGHLRPADARVHGRGLRLRPPDRGAAGEEADPDHPQAGARVRGRDGAGDTEHGRPRLQGDGECRHVARRPAPDRARQRTRPRGPLLRGRRDGRQGAGHDDRRFGEAGVPARQREEPDAGAVRVPLGDVIPPRPVDERPDRDAHARRATARPRARAGRGSGRRAGGAGRGRERSRAGGRAGCARALPGPRRALGRSGRLGSRRAAAHGFPCRPRQPPVRRRKGRHRRERGVGGDLRPARRRARPRAGDTGRLRRAGLSPGCA